MFVVVSDVDSKRSVSGCERLGLSSVTRQWFVHKVFLQLTWARYGLSAYHLPAGPSLVHIVRAGCDTAGFLHKEGACQMFRGVQWWTTKDETKFLIWKKSLICIRLSTSVVDPRDKAEKEVSQKLPASPLAITLY
jgi:hypothetical protein